MERRERESARAYQMRAFLERRCEGVLTPRDVCMLTCVCSHDVCMWDVEEQSSDEVRAFSGAIEYVLWCES